MVDWTEVRNEFRVDQLIDLYVKINKNAQVYSGVDGYGKGIVWQGWVMQAGSVAGQMFSWIDGTGLSQYGVTDYIDGIYLMFDGNSYTNNKPYFIKIEPGLIDWQYIENQLDAIRKSKMAWYQLWFEKLEQKLADLYNKAKKAADTQVEAIKSGLTKVLIIGGVGFLAWTAWNSYFKYDLLLRQGAKYLKQR